jgi:hypothetical protein
MADEPGKDRDSTLTMTIIRATLLIAAIAANIWLVWF